MKKTKKAKRFSKVPKVCHGGKNRQKLATFTNQASKHLVSLLCRLNVYYGIIQDMFYV